MPCINLYPTTACDAKNDFRKLKTIASYTTKKFGIEYQGFLLRFVITEMNLIAFSGPQNCVNTQYTALSGAMIYASLVKIHPLVQKIMHGNPILNISKCQYDLEN